MRINRAILTFLLFTAFGLSVTAQTQGVVIEEVVINGDEIDILSKQTKMSEINAFMPRTAGDVFENMPGLNILKRSSFSVEPSINMFKREQINLMFDGGTKITQSCANRMDAMTTRISAGEIDKIEVIKGPYSVRFGQSFGGVINVITKRAPASEKFKLHGSADMAYNFNGDGISSGVELGGANQKFDFLINGTYRDFGNYTSGDDIEIISSFTAYDYSVKTGYNINKNNRIQLSFRQSKAEDVMHAGLPMDALDDDGKLLSLDYIYKNSSSVLRNIKLKIYGSDVDHLMTNEFKKTYKFTTALAPVESQTLGGKADFTFLLNNKTTVYAGFDSNYKAKNGVRNREVKINACTGAVLTTPMYATDKLWQDSHTADYGIFAKMNYIPNKNVKIEGGIRSDFVQSDILDPEDDFKAFYEDNLYPESQNTVDFFGKINYKLPNNFNLSFAAGKASRTPDLLELFINHSSVGQDAYEYLGNPQLKAEKNMQSDIVISKKGEKYFVYADVFYSYITDFITAKVDSTIPRKFTPCMEPAFTKHFENVDKVMQYGIDAGFNIEIIKDLNFQTNLTYTYAQNVSWDEPVPEISPLTVNSNIAYKYKDFFVSINNRYVAKQDRIALSFAESASESFDVINLNMTYKLTKFASLSLGIDNIADVNYYEHTSRAYRSLPEQLMFYEPGRSIKLACKVYF